MEENITACFYESPIGKLYIQEKNRKISALSCRPDAIQMPTDDIIQLSEEEAIQRQENNANAETPASPLLQEAVKQLGEYFRGERTAFTLPLCLEGTDFQQKAWAALQTIPYGETRSYGQLAAQLGNPKACRAVGGANNKNPVMILVPCHRVIGSDGSLMGFAGGLEVKKYLLELEKRTKQNQKEWNSSNVTKEMA